MPVQYVKEANICSVHSVISIYLFSLLGELLFFPVLEEKGGQLQPCILTNVTAAVCALASEAFCTQGETKLHI